MPLLILLVVGFVLFVVILGLVSLAKATSAAGVIVLLIVLGLLAWAIWFAFYKTGQLRARREIAEEKRAAQEQAARFTQEKCDSEVRREQFSQQLAKEYEARGYRTVRTIETDCPTCCVPANQLCVSARTGLTFDGLHQSRFMAYNSVSGELGTAEIHSKIQRA
jgi:hypothetical protein